MKHVKATIFLCLLFIIQQGNVFGGNTSSTGADSFMKVLKDITGKNSEEIDLKNLSLLLEIQNDKKETPIHLLVEEPKEKIEAFFAGLKDYLTGDQLKKLLEKQDDDKQTPLHLLVKEPEEQIEAFFKGLKDCGLTANQLERLLKIQDDNKQTPVFYLTKGSEKQIKAFLKGLNELDSVKNYKIKNDKLVVTNLLVQLTQDLQAITLC